MTVPPKTLAKGVSAYFALLSLVIVVYLWHAAKHLGGWAIADWLINYEGGFIRRGLFGQIVLLLSRLTHVQPANLAAGFMMLTYIVVAASVSLFLPRLRWSFAWLALLLSPATLEFPVLNPPIVLKKEFLVFAVLAIFVYWLLKRPKVSIGMVWTLTFVIAVMGLIHELALIYSPYFFVALFLVDRNWRRILRLIIFPMFLLAAVAVAIVLHPGSFAAGEAICHSLGGVWPGDVGSLCSGTIFSLGITIADTKTSMAVGIFRDHYFPLYIPTAVLTCIPILLIVRRLVHRGKHQYELRWFGLAAGLSFLASLELFRMASDWGRWLHIHAMCCMILLLMIDRRNQSDPEDAGLTFNAKTLLPAVAVFLYAACWTLPGLVYFPERLGYVGLAHYLGHYDRNVKGH